MFTDRSRILAYRTCPRLRWLAYHHLGHGITKQVLSIPLATGTYIHMGLAALLGGASEDLAVELARDAYWEAAHQALGSASGAEPSFLYVLQEQTALTEALVRVYARRGLPALREKYDILGVETEYEFELVSGITFMARLDGELLNRETGEVEVLSFKTDTGSRLDSKIADARIDLQGLTEPEAYGRHHGKVPFGVKMEWLVKGSRKEDASGREVQDSFLVRPWMRHNVGGVEYAWQYYYPCPGVEHKITKADGKTWKCPGTTGQHGLGPSWTRVNIWEQMPVKDWIDLLAADQVQPGLGDPLAEVLYSPEPIYRTGGDRLRAMRSVRAQEEHIAFAEHLYKDTGLSLDELFPQNTQACNHIFGGDCQFKELCFAADPDAALVGMPQGFVPRTPHHAGETKSLIQIKETI